MEDQSTASYPFFEVALFSGGLLLFAAVLILAFSLKNENLQEKNRFITWFRKTDLEVQALVSRLKFAEKIVPDRDEKGAVRLTYTEPILTATGILPPRDPRIRLSLEGRDLVRKELSGGGEKNRATLFQEVETFQILVQDGTLRLDLALLSPDEKTPVLFNRWIALDHNP